MFSAKRITPTSVVMLAFMSCIQPALAEELSAAAPVPAAAEASSTAPLLPESSRPASVPTDVVRGPFGSKPLSSDALASRRGGDRVFNDAQLKGVVSDNRASNLTTGSNAISNGAFTNAAGIPTVIQNSGNNVLIQSATIVNVQLK